MREGLPGFRLPLPFWTGCDIAGDVVQAGTAASGVTVGDRVAVNPNLHCGRCEYCRKGEQSLCVSYGILGEHVQGGLAEYVRVAADKVLTLPTQAFHRELPPPPGAGGPRGPADPRESPARPGPADK